jgi:cysteinyl-tRNA synthetase
MNTFVFDVLGLKNDLEQNASEKLNGVVEMLIKMRKEARDNRNWALSDKIRDELATLGIQLKDGKEGTTFSIN